MAACPRLFQRAELSGGGAGFPTITETRRSLAMTSTSQTLLGALLGAGVLAFSGASASAAIVCSGNVCWHAHELYEYPPEAHVIIRPDNWRWGPHERYIWREREGRGYWRGDTWMEW